MVNAVTCKIILRTDQVNANGECSIAAQCFVNRQRVVITLAKVQQKYFDAHREMVKSSCPSSVALNKIIGDARYRALLVLSDANVRNIQLNAKNFRAMFTMTQPDIDFISFYEQEMKKRKGELQGNSYRLHNKTLNKLRAFRSSIPFSQLTPALLADFERYLKKDLKNGINTIYSELKNVRTYTYIAIRRGVEIHNPFLHYKLKRGGSKIIFCTIEETQTILQKFDNNNFPERIRTSVLSFLVSCFTSLRISDVKRLDEQWIHDDTLTFIAHKTRRFNRTINIPLSEVALRLLQIFFDIKNSKGFKADQKINDDLKLMAAYCGITKTISNHVGRHTFATTFLELGGSVEVLQQLMGHAHINETMVYVHITDKRKEIQIDFFNQTFK